MLLYGSDIFMPNARSFSRLNTCWHKVQRWTTNCFSSTPMAMLAIEACLPPVPLLISPQKSLAALQAVCSCNRFIPV